MFRKLAVLLAGVATAAMPTGCDFLELFGDIIPGLGE